jgi:hypothetical protein
VKGHGDGMMFDFDADVVAENGAFRIFVAGLYQA